MIDSELQTFLPLEVSDSGTNGGRMSASQVISGVVQNVWPHVPKAERTSGSRKYRKLFDKVGNDDDETLINPGYYLDGDTLGEDWAFFFPTDQRSTQADWTGTPPSRKYVSGPLLVAVVSTDSTLTVILQDAEQSSSFIDGDMVRVSDKTDPDQVAGNEAFLTITGAPIVSGKEVTMTFTSQIGFDFSANVTKICGVYEPGVDISCEVSGWTVTTAGDGDADEAQLSMDNISTIEQTWTVSRTTANTFTVSGDTVGSIDVGDSAVDYQPSNPDWSRPYFILPSAMWSGTWAAGDTLVFTTSPASQPLVQERVVPAGCASLANNRIRKVTIGESQ